MFTTTVFIKDTGCGAQDRTRDVFTLCLDYLREKQLDQQVQVVRVADIGVYGQGVVMKIMPGDTVYAQVKDSDIGRLIDAAVAGKTVDELRIDAAPKQIRIVLRNCGEIDPENIEEYIGAGGYLGLKKALLEMTPEQVIDEMKKSGLRGRGGAGFPTWMKWNLTRQVEAEQKYVICNGDEGDPGAYMDRSVLEGDPHSVIEGLAIAAYAIGASKGYFYIRAEYPLAVERIEKAIKQAYSFGLLGSGILGSSFNFEVEIRLGAGAFVCGEETALIASIEGRRGTPRPRPPFPSVRGLWDKPTAINNVETLANVPFILFKGASAYAAIGTEKSKGTKVFALTGKVRNSGLVEVPMGITLRQIVYDIGGGTISGKAVKAVQTGGPSGGVIPIDYLDTPVDYENLQKLGSIMGSGGMIVMDEDDCMVDIAKFYLGFCVDESCGKCAPCRIGGFRMLGVLKQITEGNGKPADMAALKRIGVAMNKASLCGLGQTAANPVLSTMRYFEEEYRQHIELKKCPSGKCRALASYRIIEEKCKRCTLCQLNCPVGAIPGTRETGFAIVREKCIKCGNCFEVCKFKAVAKE